MILNRQSKIKIDIREASSLTGRLCKILGLEGGRFNVCFVDDHQICALNTAYRQKPAATDVLSFQWKPGTSTSGLAASESDPQAEFEGFLGDVVISAETAHRNGQAEGHGPHIEISWLILHGLLHLIGMDHETDRGEMVALEHDLRARLGIEGGTEGPTRTARRAVKSPPKRTLKPAREPRTRPSC